MSYFPRYKNCSGRQAALLCAASEFLFIAGETGRPERVLSFCRGVPTKLLLSGPEHSSRHMMEQCHHRSAQACPQRKQQERVCVFVCVCLCVCMCVSSMHLRDLVMHSHTLYDPALCQMDFIETQSMVNTPHTLLHTDRKSVV